MGGEKGGGDLKQYGGYCAWEIGAREHVGSKRIHEAGHTGVSKLPQRVSFQGVNGTFGWAGLWRGSRPTTTWLAGHLAKPEPNCRHLLGSYDSRWGLGLLHAVIGVEAGACRRHHAGKTSEPNGKEQRKKSF